MKEERYFDGGRSCCFADDDVVISGISGRFPQADNMEELKDILYSKKSVIANADHRWPSDLPGYPKNRFATVKDLSKFDNDFFNVPANVASTIDPLQRIMLEVTYEAIVDAGYSSKELAGRHVGVFIGLSDPDSLAILHCGNEICESKHATGYIACMAANRISHKYDFLGPSFAVDTACASSGTCLDDAFRRIRDGSIEAAIVGGAHLVLDPRSSKSFYEIGILSPTGESRVFDADSDGLVKSESLTAIFLQRRKDARRVYAKVINVECLSAGHIPEGISVPSLRAESYLFRKAYEKIDIDPSEIDYIEAHGTGTKAGDSTEINAIEEIFCKNRKTPLLLGGVKSSLGHSECASAICSIAKVILSFESGVIPPNINYENPNPKCPGLVNGKIKVITEPTPLHSSLAAVNNFGFGGINVHVTLERNDMEKSSDSKETVDPIPKLVVYSATTEKALTDMFNRFHQSAMPTEFFSLLNKSAYNSSLLCPYRGFTVVQRNTPGLTSIENVHPVKRQVWYVFTGMGCQWPGMGLDLMQMEIFRKTMTKLAKVLEPLGVDLLEFLRPDEDHLQQERVIIPAFTAITAIQIALVDVLNSLGLKPNGMIGHSAGELACGYSDGCCSAEETILSAYYRGISVESSCLPEGAMAAVGLSWEETKRRCPEGVYPACDNSDDSVTISGLKTAVEKFVEELEAENIFARVVKTYGYGFHSKTISGASQALHSSLHKVYKNPKPRSKRWLSTCYCESDWDSPECQLADANYFCHNLISQVHFRGALSHIPPDAIVVEVGPHFLLQSIVKRKLGNKISYVGLMKKHDNNVDFLLSSIGKLYNLGLDPQVENLYPPVSFPVPRGTPMISPMIKWDHSLSHFVPKFAELSVGSSNILIKSSSSDSYLLDHCIDGRSLFPATGYIYLAWKALSSNIRKPMETLPVVIENFKIVRATILSPRDDKTFEVSILNLSGDFEIGEGGSIVATGKISVSSKIMFDVSDFTHDHETSAIIVSGREIYDELKIHGYEYGPAFQGLLEVNIEGNSGMVKWTDDWISFLDSLLMFFGLINEDSDFRLPTGALSVKIDPKVHMEFVSRLSQDKPNGTDLKIIISGLKRRCIPVKYDKHIKKCSTPGVEIRSLMLEPAPRRADTEITPVFEEYNFTPYYEERALSPEQTVSCEEYIHVCCHLGNEIANISKDKAEIHKILLGGLILNKDIDVQAVMKSADENWILLKTLQNMREMSRSVQFASRLEAVCHDLRDIIGRDLLFNVMLEEKPLRSLLDVAIENSFGKLCVVEWCDGGPKLMPAVQDFLKCFSQAKTSFALLYPSTTAIDAKSLSDNVSVTQTSGNGEDIPSNFKDSGDLVITSFILGTNGSLKTRIRNVISLTKEDGFILFFHKRNLTPPEALLHLLSKQHPPVLNESEVEKQLADENLLIVCKKCSFTGVTAYLLRKPHSRVRPLNVRVVEILGDKYDQWINKLKNCMSLVQERDNPAVVWLVAQDTRISGIVGMVNCLKQEPGGDRIRCVFTDNYTAPFDTQTPFFAEMMKKDLLMNVYQEGEWGSFRHSSLSANKPEKFVDMAYIECTKLGDLSSFTWLESPIKYIQSEHPEKQLYHVYYSSLNFRDVMLATGKLSVGALSESGIKFDGGILGMEFSGRDCQGRRVMGMIPQGALSNTVFAKPVAVYDVPDHWSLEEAATVPVVYTTCYFALMIRGRLSKGEKVLIHSGTGGIGQAAIRICLSLDCEVFATVGTQEKRNFLLKTFPQLKPQNIGCSRDTTFEEMVMTQTVGKGVDVVLNSLADDKFQASVRCLGKHGRFLEIGKYDISLDHSLGLRVFLKDVDFQGVMLDSWFSDDSRDLQFHQELRKLVNDGIKSGVVQPLNTTVFPIREVERAFRFMGSGKHVGKVLIKVREEDSKKTVVPSSMKIVASRELYLYPRKSYVIIGGLGGFGIELAKWLIRKGAGTIVLTSRYGARTPYHHLCLKRWQDSGARVIVSTLNVASREEAKQLLEEIEAKYGPVGGIFNSAAVLRDAFIENQSASDFELVCAPKALATKHLDELTRSLCPEIDMFVCFSSISCGKGNAGQANYGYANSVMERICEQRKKDGLHGLAVQWGIIGDVGLVHRNMGEDAMIAGVMSQSIKSCLRALEGFLLQDAPVVSSFVTADKSRMKKKSDDIFSQLAKIFSIPDIEKMNPYRTFGEMGMDSMTGVELKQLLETSLDVDMGLQEIQELKLVDVRDLVNARDKTKELQVSPSRETHHFDFHGLSVVLPTQPLIPLNSSKQGTPVFVVHVNDLLHDKLKILWETVSCPVFAIRSTKDSPMSTLKDMALWYLKQIQQACSCVPVHLASYSTASNLALEMALQSDNQKTPLPYIKSLTFIDSSLELMEIHTTTEQEKKKNVALYEASDLCRFLKAFSDSDLTQLQEQLALLPNLENRINMVTSLMPSVNKRSFVETIEIYVKKQNALRLHVPCGKLKTDLIVIEASNKVLPNDVSAVKSFLSEICCGRVTVQRLTGNDEFLVGKSSANEVADLLNKLYTTT